MEHNTPHVSVMTAEVLSYLAPKEGESYFDATAGYGGHAGEVLKRTKGSAVLADRDAEAIAHLRLQFKAKNIDIRHQDFLGASQGLLADNRQFDLILADLGVSSPHLNKASRGFSFNSEGPLDMRMDQNQSLTAEVIVNSYSQEQLSGLIRRWGEEPKAGRIAGAIVKNRPVKTTKQLADIVEGAARRRGRAHPATKTFQALRIAVNDELAQLEQALPLWIKLLTPGGRLAVISFHSLEDRLVKLAFKEAGEGGYDAELKILTKKAAKPNTQEIAFNPRARSAKLRAAVKIKT